MRLELTSGQVDFGSVGVFAGEPRAVSGESAGIAIWSFLLNTGMIVLPSVRKTPYVGIITDDLLVVIEWPDRREIN